MHSSHPIVLAISSIQNIQKDYGISILMPMDVACSSSRPPSMYYLLSFTFVTCLLFILWPFWFFGLCLLLLLVSLDNDPVCSGLAYEIYSGCGIGHVFAYLYILDDDLERQMDYETSLIPKVFLSLPSNMQMCGLSVTYLAHIPVFWQCVFVISAYTSFEIINKKLWFWYCPAGHNIWVWRNDNVIKHIHAHHISHDLPPKEYWHVCVYIKQNLLIAACLSHYMHAIGTAMSSNMNNSVRVLTVWDSTALPINHSQQHDLINSSPLLQVWPYYMSWS